MAESVQMFGVVEHKERALAAEPFGHLVPRPVGARVAERGGDRVRYLTGIIELGQGHEYNAATDTRCDRPRDPRRQLRLPRPARAGQRHNLRRLHEARKFGYLILTTDYVRCLV